MPNEFLTLLDLAARNQDSGIVPLIEKDIVIAPEVGKFPAMMIDGVSYDCVVRESLPTSSYVKPGNGIDTSRSRYSKKTVELKYRDGQMQVYESHYLADKRGGEVLLADEMDGMIKAALRALGRQLIYGSKTGGNTNGFPGAVEVVDNQLVVDAGGTTDDVASSVYAFKLGEDMCKIIGGNNRLLSPGGEWVKQQVLGADSKPTMAYVNNLSGWEGMQWVNPYCVGRIKKITTDSGKTMKDDWGYDLLEKFAAVLGEAPDFFLMTPRSAGQLRKSRITANVATPEWPTEIAGIPILQTNSILNTEKLTL